MDLKLDQNFPNAYDNINNTLTQSNPIILVSLTVIIIFYYLIFSYLGVGATSLMGDGNPNIGNAMGDGGIKTGYGFTLIEILLWALFIFLILINGLQYFFELDIKASIKNIFSPVPEVDISVEHDEVKEEETVPEIKFMKQVYHVPDNIYTYDDAKAICKAYGSELADYTQIEEAYKDGAEWCGYGWSKDQLALYPTQQEKYDLLQKMKGHEHDCGRPGINGGYIANKNVKFGANCYGYKPVMTDEEELSMNQTLHIPKTQKQKDFDKKVELYRSKLPNIRVAPFNNSKWSQI